MSTQLFKSIYFKEDNSFDFARGKRVTVSFSEKERNVFDSIFSLSNEEIRELIAVDNYQALIDLALKEERTLSKFIKLRIKKSLNKDDQIKSSDVTFQNSKKIPFQRWFVYLQPFLDT